MAAAQILREMGGDWLECQDAQGIFYHNAATKQSCDTLPAELMANAGAGAGGKSESAVLRELPDNWLECQDAQGIFYFNKVTQQSSDTLPPELNAWQAPAGPAPVAVPMVAPAPVAAAPVAAAQSAVLQELPNGWLECQDDLGIYYFNQITQQSSDTLPPELATIQMGGVVATVPAAAPFQVETKVMPMAAPSAAPMLAPVAIGGGIAPIKATVLGGGINSYQPVLASSSGVTNSYQPYAAAPASYTPPNVSQQPRMQQVMAGHGSYTPVQFPQQPYVHQVGQPQAVFQQPQPQVVYQQPQPQIVKAAQQPVQIQAPSQPGMRKISGWGDWEAYMDARGVEFFVQVSTGQRFDSPPQAAVQSYQAYKAAGLVIA